MTTDVSALSLLPRLDWRFLGDPCLGETVFLGDAGHPMLTALQAVDATVAVNPPLPHRAGFDTAVVVAPLEDTLRQAAGLLRPGGRLYVQLPRSATPWQRPSSMRRWRDLASGAGFGEIAAYWHVPSFEGCAHVVPISDRHALHQVARRHQGTTRGAFKSAMLHLATSARATPCVAGDVSMVARLRSDATTASGLDTTSVAADATTRLLVTPRFRTSRHVVRLASDPVTRAGLVVKLPRISTDTSGIAHEAAVLRELAERWPAGRGTFPVVRALHVEGHPALVETKVRGTVLTHRYVARRPAESVRAVRSWIESLPVSGSTSTDPQWFGRLVEQPLSELAQWESAGNSTGLSELVRRTVAAASLLCDHDLPLVFEHGDVTCPNVFMDRDGRISLVDWELAEPAGLPGTDMMHFLAFVSFAVAGVHDVPGQVRAFHDSFFGPRPWAARLARSHLRQRGVDEQLLAPLMLATWGRYAAKIGPRLRRLATTVDGESPRLIASVIARDRDVAIWRSLVTSGVTNRRTASFEPEEPPWVI